MSLPQWATIDERVAVIGFRLRHGRNLELALADACLRYTCDCDRVSADDCPRHRIYALLAIAYDSADLARILRPFADRDEIQTRRPPYG